MYTDKRRDGVLAQGDAAHRAGDGFSGVVEGGDLHDTGGWADLGAAVDHVDGKGGEAVEGGGEWIAGHGDSFLW